MVLMTRVDCRLLHGQTAVSWTSGLGADCIENGAACCSIKQTESDSETLQIRKVGTLRWK